MGKIVKTVLPIAVGIAVPYALPALVPALAASPILTGAISGGLSALVGGGNPITGALTGALGGVASRGFTALGSELTKAATPSALGSRPDLIGGPEFFSGVGTPSLPTSAPFAAVGPSAGIVDNIGGSDLGIYNPDFVVDNIGGGVGSDGFFPGSGAGSSVGLSPASAVDTFDRFTPTRASSAGLAAGDVITRGDFGTGVFNPESVSAPTSTPGLAATLGERFTAAGEQLANDIRNPEDLVKRLGRQGVPALARALTGEERDLADASAPPSLELANAALYDQARLAEEERNFNRQQLAIRNRQAQELANLARGINPLGEGQRAAESVRVASERVLRDIPDADRRARALRRNIRTRAAAAAPTAYSQGLEAARRQQLAGLTGAAQLTPTAFSGGRGFTAISSEDRANQLFRENQGLRNALGIAGLFDSRTNRRSSNRSASEASTPGLFSGFFN